MNTLILEIWPVTWTPFSVLIFKTKLIKNLLIIDMLYTTFRVSWQVHWHGNLCAKFSKAGKGKITKLFRQSNDIYKDSVYVWKQYI